MKVSGGPATVPWDAREQVGAVLLALVQVGGTVLLAGPQQGRPGVDTLAVVLLLLGPVALAVPGRPVFSSVVAVASAAAYLAMGYPLILVGLAAGTALWRTVAAGQQAEAALVAGSGWLSAVLMSGEGLRRLLPAVAVGLGTVALLAAAEAVRARREAAEAWRGARTDRRVRQAGEVRLRLARDLHESVAHQLSLIEVRSGVALYLLEGGGRTARDEARAALAAVRGASDRAMIDLREALNLLLAEGAPAWSRPTGLDGLPALVQEWDAVGLLVTVTGRPGRLPSSVDQVTYRVIQEALMNVSRHSAATRADVQLARDGEQLIVTITDPGPARRHSGRRRSGQAGVWESPVGRTPPSVTPAPQETDDPPELMPEGRGLAALRERVTAMGGAVVAGPPKVPSATSWMVRAVLPVAPLGASSPVVPAPAPAPAPAREAFAGELARSCDEVDHGGSRAEVYPGGVARPVGEVHAGGNARSGREARPGRTVRRAGERPGDDHPGGNYPEDGFPRTGRHPAEGSAASGQAVDGYVQQALVAAAAGRPLRAGRAPAAGRDGGRPGGGRPARDPDGDTDDGYDGEGYDGEYPDEGYPDGDYPDGEYADGEYADGEYADGEYADGEYADGDYADGDYADRDYADGEYPDEDGRDDEVPPRGRPGPGQESLELNLFGMLSSR